MSERPVLPPPFRAFEVAPELDPFERCLALAGEGAEAGTLLWSSGQETCECAVVLAPEPPLRQPARRETRRWPKVNAPEVMAPPT